jgi:hypothetical protein
MADIIEFPQQMSPDDQDASVPPQGQSPRRAIIRQMGAVEKQLRHAKEEETRFRDEARAHEQKKNICSMLVGVAIANDGMTIVADAVSFGMLGSLTAPVPGILRFMVSAYEREQKPDRMFRTILVMGIKAIPAINVLPATTFLMITDLAEADADMNSARNKQQGEEKKIKKLSGELRQLKVAAQQRVA